MFSPDMDERMIQWPLMESPTVIIIIVIVYLLFVQIIGPAWMRNRKPYDLRTIMVIYNFAMVILSSWMFYKFGKHGWFHKYNWVCQEVDYSTTEDGMGIVEACWYFNMSKIIELLDTIFFVFRKKYSQISFLHVVHHSIVPLTTRLAITRGAAGYNTFFGFLNTFVHIWMYLYYALAALGLSNHKYLWWKKYLTSLQMIQFCIVFVSMTIHTLNPNCKVHALLILISLGQAIFFLVLFAHFYVTSYKKKPKSTTGTEKDSVTKSIITELENGSSSDARYRSYLARTKSDKISH